jgi:hypothetical protein
MTSESTPSVTKPQLKTVVAEYRSLAPPERRNAANVTAYEVITHDCCAKLMFRSTADAL